MKHNLYIRERNNTGRHETDGHFSGQFKRKCIGNVLFSFHYSKLFQDTIVLSVRFYYNLLFSRICYPFRNNSIGALKIIQLLFLLSFSFVFTCVLFFSASSFFCIQIVCVQFDYYEKYFGHEILFVYLFVCVCMCVFLSCWFVDSKLLY